MVRSALLRVRIESEPLRIVIDGRLTSGLSGGVESVVIGLASALSRLDDGPEKYFFLTTHGQDDWLRPYANNAVGLLPCPLPGASLGIQSSGLRSLAEAFPRLADAWRGRRWFPRPIVGPPKSD